MTAPARPAIGSTSKVIALVAATQFVSAIEFIILLPLGPDLARGLDMPTSHLGYVTSSYGIAAFGVGLVSANLLDKFDRRTILCTSLLGLVLATALCGLAVDTISLLIARFIAGAFAGPTAAIGLALISDLVPPERRGRAVTTVITAGSLASIVGMPAAIWLAQLYGWRTPFLTIAVVGTALLLLLMRTLPAMTGHLTSGAQETFASKARMMASPVGLAAMTAMILSTASGFLLITSLPIHLQANLHIPPTQFAWFYMAGGCSAFIVTRVSGPVIDRFGSWPVMLVSNCLFALVVWELLVDTAALLPIMVLFIGSMTANGLRNASLQTAITHIPPPSRRGAFLSVTGSMSYLGSAIGAAASSVLLFPGIGTAVGGMDRVGWATIAITATLTPMVLLLNALRRRESDNAVPVPSEEVLLATPQQVD